MENIWGLSYVDKVRFRFKIVTSLPFCSNLRHCISARNIITLGCPMIKFERVAYIHFVNCARPVLRKKNFVRTYYQGWTKDSGKPVFMNAHINRRFIFYLIQLLKFCRNFLVVFNYLKKFGDIFKISTVTVCIWMYVMEGHFSVNCCNFPTLSRSYAGK